jgi:hypothetical protein
MFNKLLTYEDVKLLGDGESVYYINSNNNTPQELIIVSKDIENTEDKEYIYTLRQKTGFKQCDQIDIEFKEGMFYGTPEAAILSVSNNVQNIFDKELFLLAKELQEMHSRLNKITTLWYTYRRLTDQIEAAIPSG